ncbi:hypothetical protein IQ279_00530 [Streptomyces verrucosisporus]|uniref:hypothetical protein n=1 Tax=Streptomyces verrucosisporus TaxID=1695161 RepID=UPI0019D02C1D|nr:hypothetical protein [Streptomyces verrucosisporus]MBN3928140.1 hypothetical protein [Streptomyces verrucosisporus]
MSTNGHIPAERRAPLADRAGRPEWTDDEPPADRAGRTEPVAAVQPVEPVEPVAPDGSADRADGRAPSASSPRVPLGESIGTAAGTTAGTAAGSAAHGDANGHRPEDGDAGTGLLTPRERERFGRRLHEAVTGFVDGPRRSVEEADAVFEEISHRITELLTERHRRLREPWHGEDSAEHTEDLRRALREYRDAADRLLRL